MSYTDVCELIRQADLAWVDWRTATNATPEHVAFLAERYYHAESTAAAAALEYNRDPEHFPF